MTDHTRDYTSNGSSYSALAFSFLAGGIAGAAAALLLAPQSGKVTRETMGRQFNDAADSVRELKDRTIRRGQEIREEATHRAEGAASALAGKAGQRERGGNGDRKAGDSPA
jgi:gas vesicle protein